MATPVKFSEAAVVPDISRCLACSEGSQQKYYAVNKKGAKGPAFEAVEAFYDIKLACNDNFGAFVCKQCLRTIQRILDMKEDILRLAKQVLTTSQNFQMKTSSKRVIERTPDESSKKITRAKEKDTHRSRAHLDFTPFVSAQSIDSTRPMTPCSPLQPLQMLDNFQADKGVQCDLKKAATRIQQSRKEVNVYTSMKVRTLISPAVKCLTMGSYRKAVKMMLSSESEHVKEQTLKGISDRVKLECDTILNTNPNLLKKNSEEELLTFSFGDVTDKMKGTVIWEVLCAAAKNRKSKHDYVKVTTACMILFYSRSKFLCKFQHLVAISMYNNQLQREGYNILTKLGLTVSHQTLHSCLRKAQSNIDEKMLVLKAGVEDNRTKDIVPAHIRDHSYSHLAEIAEITAHPYSLPEDQESQQSFHPGFRFNMDNLDFVLKVRDMTEEHQNKSLHYVQVMAVVDRVNCEHLPDDKPVGDLNEVDNHEFLPTAEDNNSLRDDIIHIMALILADNVPAFKLPLGILDKSENKMNDMIDILEYLHQYVPNARSTEEIENVDQREDRACLRVIPLGGDQLTCERVRGAHAVCLDGDTPEERLEGCMAMVEDFHEKMNFLQVMMDKFYKPASAREGGTLYQLRNVINRRNVATDVSSNYHNASAFIDIAGESHVIVAALEFFGMENLDSECIRIPRGAHLADKNQKRRMLHQMLGELVDEVILNDIARSIEVVESNVPVTFEEQDKIYNYAANFLKLYLLRKVNLLATRSGDGQRVVRHWKYAMLLYYNSHKTKYRLEAFLFLAGILALYSPRHRHQIIWNRFVNLSGGRGKNVDGDYVMELLNKYAKGRVKLVGPNHSAELVMRIGKTMMYCHDIQVRLERQVRAECLSRHHSTQDTNNDLLKLVGELSKAEVFKIVPGRSHQSFQNEHSDIFSEIDVVEFHKWLQSKKRNMQTINLLSNALAYVMPCHIGEHTKSVMVYSVI